MRRVKTEDFSPPAVGGISLLVVFAVLCLTVFALLSLSTARAGDRLSLALAQSAAGYYEADCEAQEILARLRAGERPDDVTIEDGICRYRCEISDTQALEVEVRLKGDSYEILRWQAAANGNWEIDETLELWSGPAA